MFEKKKWFLIISTRAERNSHVTRRQNMPLNAEANEWNVQNQEKRFYVHMFHKEIDLAL